MAPELRNGEKPSVASDIYALGCICYEMLGGTRVRSEPLRVHPRWNGIVGQCLAPNWSGILVRCLAKDPAQRYQSVEEIEEALAPKIVPRWGLVAASVILAAATGAVVYEIVTAPKETVRLAMAPLETDGATASFAATLSRDTPAQISRIKSNSRTRFRVVPLNKATHMLRGNLSQKDGKIILSAHVTDERAHANGKSWRFEYAPSDFRYAAVAFAGIVTAGFQLPPLTVNATLNRAAAEDYWNGMYYLRRNSTLDKAIASMKRAVTEDPASPLTYAGLAEAQWYEYRIDRDQVWLDRVRESLRDAEERNPDLAPVHRVQGYLDYAAGLYELAISEYQRAIQLDPNEASSHMWLGWAYEDANHSDEALTELQKAVDLDPKYVRTNQVMGAYYLEHSKFQQGAEYYKRAVDLAPDEPNLRLNLARSYSDSGRFPEAEQQLRYSIALHETMGAVFSLGLTLMYEREDREAIPFLERASSLNSSADGTPKCAPLMYLGIAHRRLGNRIAALEANRRGLAIAARGLENPRDGYALSFAAYFDAAVGDRLHAESEIKQALGLSAISPVRWNAILTYELLDRRNDTLALLSSSTPEQLADVSRWPDLTNLQKDNHFLQLLAAHQIR
jgi:tetratricopeptide (TPR) repeat protein